jgi:hypothetical protein
MREIFGFAGAFALTVATLSYFGKRFEPIPGYAEPVALVGGLAAFSFYAFAGALVISWL